MLPSEAFNGTHQAAEPTVVFETGDGRERIWAVQNADNNFELVSAGPLSGGKWDEPSTLGSHLNEGGDANYPFLMSDGMTLYFANDGEKLQNTPRLPPPLRQCDWGLSHRPRRR